MKRILIYMLLLITFSELYSQGLYNNGAKIVVSSGAYLNVAGNSGGYLNATNVTDGTMSLDGTVKIEGDVVNNATASDLISTSTPASTVILSGTTAQTVSGTSTVAMVLPNLTINNLAGVALTKDVTVSGTTTLTNGLLDIGNNNFTFGATGTFVGTPSTAKMIVATGIGQVRKLMTGIGSFSFPIGDNNVTAKYSPVSLNFTAGTFAAGAYAAVNVVNAAYTDPYVKTSYLKRYWNLSQTGITAFSTNANFTYDATDVVGTESQVSTTRISPAPIVAYGIANTTLHQMAANSLTSFGTFTGVLDQTTKTLSISSLMLQGLYNGSGTMRQAFDDLGAHWPAGVADHITVELHDATTYATVAYSVANVALSTTGTATVTIPGTYNGSYYITIKHRNSIQTTTATAVSFVGNTINQSYGTPADVFGGNIGLSVDNHYLIYSGDVNQDGVIDSGDLIPVINDYYNYLGGYLSTDIDGNGVIDSSDLIPIINNFYNYIGIITP